MTDDGGISRSVLAEQVKDRLLQDILSGRYPSHSRIVETRVARELGTSQAPVREALRGLEALGVIEILPFRGARVRHPSRSELLEAYVVRSELEALAARLGVPRMTDAHLAEIEALLEAMERAADSGDRHEVALADATFHGRLIRLAGNATLERVWRSLEPFSRTYITLVAPGADTHWTAGLHPGIVEALRTRDPERVVTALRDHFDQASAHLAEGWQDADVEPAPVRTARTARTTRTTSRPAR
jgi:DNA-binding GntR family transcriptional regulator